MDDPNMTKDLRVYEIAAVCHEANRMYCMAIGDMSQAPWVAAPIWQQNSAIAGVKFHLNNPHAGDAASHENWMADKLRDGWQYGEEKDADAKRHPCLVPFKQLPIEQQRKDALFRAIVHALAPQPRDSEHDVEQMIVDKGLTAPRLGPPDIDRAIVDETFTILPSGKVMVCELTLRNGFTVRGDASVVSRANFDPEIGRKVSRDKARGKVWELEGYLLQQRLFDGVSGETSNNL